MKKLLALLAAGCLALGLFGCSAAQPEPPAATLPSVVATTEPTPPVTESVDISPEMYAIVLPPVTEMVSADDGTALFSLSFQKVQMILHNQALEEKIIGNLEERMGPVLSDATQFEAQARLDYQETEYWSEYFIDVSYTPTRLDQAVLSLFGNSFSYRGGPHPSLMTDSVTYDLQTGDVMFLDDILTPECTSDTLYQLVLKCLAGQAEDLYYDYADALGDRFTGELHSIQDWYFSRNGLCFHFAPYDIAPYSSGTIIAELPYSDLTGVLKAKYIPTESASATGSMYAESFPENVSERFTFIASIPLNEHGSDMLLYPDATVTDVRVETGSRYADNNQYIPGATVFAANIMNVGNAIRLTAVLTDTDTVFRLVYRSNSQEYSAFIAYDETENAILLTNN